MKNAILIGASTGIGKELARELASAGWNLVLTARRLPLLEELQKELAPMGVKVRVETMDVTQVNESIAALEALMQEEDAGLVIVNAGVSFLNKELDWVKENNIIQTNVTGAAALCAAAMRFFLVKGRGHLVGVSSIAGVRGLANVPAYSASKAFLSNYLESLRLKARKSRKPIYVTDIRPGYVATPMTDGQANMFWVADAKTASRQILRAIESKRDIAYIIGRWAWVARLMRHLPVSMLAKFQ